MLQIFLLVFVDKLLQTNLSIEQQEKLGENLFYEICLKTLEKKQGSQELRDQSLKEMGCLNTQPTICTTSPLEVFANTHEKIAG